MAAQHIIDTEARLIITRWKGDAIDIELIEALKRYQRDIQTNPEYLDYNELVDFREAGTLQVSTEGIKSIGRIASATDGEARHRKLALIVASDLAFGLARMYEVYRDVVRKSNKEIRTFKDEDEARDWLKT